MEDKQRERMQLIDQIKKITKEEESKQSKKQRKLLETQQYLKSVMAHKSKAKELEKASNLREENKMIQDQIGHYDQSSK